MLKVINAFVDIIGDSVTHTINGMFDAVNESTVIIPILHSDNNTKPTAVTGILKENINGQEVPISNVRVSFIKDYVINDSNITNKDYEATRVLSDYCITNDKGEYNVFLKSGNYAIRVDGGKYTGKIISNQNVTSSLNNYYYTVEDLVKRKNNDVIEFCNTDMKLISGSFIDQNKKPVPNVEIIITKNNEIVSYVTTDVNGKYSFALDEGVYDIRIRSNKHSIKIIRNFEFLANKGFFEPLNLKM